MYFRSDDSSTPRIIFWRRGKPLGYYYFATINNEVNTDALAKDPSQWKGECIQVSQLNASPTERLPRIERLDVVDETLTPLPLTKYQISVGEQKDIFLDANLPACCFVAVAGPRV